MLGNDLIDNMPENEGPTPAKAAKGIRQGAGQVSNAVSQFVVRVEKVVTRHTRVAIASELGSDAAAMLSFYSACRAFLAAQAPGLPSPELPE